MASKMVEFADRIMAGEITIDQVPELIRPSVAHLILLPIHRMAVDVLNAPTKEQRQFKLSRVPELLRPSVKAEAERVFNYLRNKNV